MKLVVGGMKYKIRPIFFFSFNIRGARDPFERMYTGLRGEKRDGNLSNWRCRYSPGPPSTRWSVHHYLPRTGSGNVNISYNTYVYMCVYILRAFTDQV